MPIFAPNWIFSRFTTGIFGGVRIPLVGQCIYKYIYIYTLPYQKYSYTNKYPYSESTKYPVGSKDGH